MLIFLNILIVISMLAVLGTLIFGFVNMVRGGEGSAARSNVLMRYRVGIQFIAVVLILIAVIVRQNISG